MADGVFMQPQSGFSDTIATLLQARYADAANKAAAARQAQQHDQDLRAGIANRLTLQGPDGAPASPNDYLSMVYGGAMAPGLTATPTTLATGETRASAQKDIAAEKTAEQLKAEGVKLRQHWGAQLQPGQTRLAGSFMPPDMLKQYNIDPNEKIGSSQKPTGKGGGSGSSTDPRLANLKAQEKTAKDEFEAAVKKIKDNTFYHQADHDALTEKQNALANIRQQMQALQSGGGAAPAGNPLLDKYGVPGQK